MRNHFLVLGILTFMTTGWLKAQSLNPLMKEHNRINQLSVSFKGMYSYRLTSMAGLTETEQSYERKLGSGFGLGFNIEYTYGNEKYGSGIAFRDFRMSNSSGNSLNESNDYYSDGEFRSDDIRVFYLGLIAPLWQELLFDGRQSVYFGGGLGYVRYRDRGSDKEPFFIKGNGPGILLEGEYGFILNRSFSLDFYVSLLLSRNANIYVDQTDENEYGFAPLNVGLSLRYTMKLKA